MKEVQKQENSRFKEAKRLLEDKRKAMVAKQKLEIAKLKQQCQ